MRRLVDEDDANFFVTRIYLICDQLNFVDDVLKEGK